ncbi:MAG: GntP family permease, partial [Bacillota bacterium]
LLISRFKWHVFLALLVPILLFALIPGVNLEAFIDAFHTGFGSTLGSIGVVIVLGSLIAEAMKNTGAVERITMSMINLVGRRRMPFALTLTGYILGIAIFGDVAYVIVNPLVHAAALEFGASMGLMASGLVGALQLTHAIVPPTPGPLAAAAVIGADIGMVILYGGIASLVGAVACWLWAVVVGSRLDAAPSREFVGQSLVEQGREEDLPSTSAAYMPITVPILLIAGQSVANLIWPEGNAITRVLTFVGWPVVALGLGFWLAARGVRREQKSEATSSWVEKALATSAIIFAVTGLGGSLSEILKGTPAVDYVAALVIDARIPTIFLPFLVGVIVNMITGSSTVGVITSAALMNPLLGPLGLSAEAAVISAASGSIVIKYVNSSYFWVCTTLSRMEVDRAVIAYGGATLVGGVAAFLATCVMWAVGLI